MAIIVLRLGHRLPRDERISTHVALVSRAFGASGIIYSGEHDSGLEESVERICSRWGAGDGFSIAYEKSPLRIIRDHKKKGFRIIHLTMYGMPVMEKLSSMKNPGNLLIVVGSEKVPSEVYELADFNVSVTSQPHSEVAALAILLDRLQDGAELGKTDFAGEISITPSEKGKSVREPSKSSERE